LEGAGWVGRRPPAPGQPPEQSWATRAWPRFYHQRVAPLGV